MLLPALHQARDKARRTQCAGNLKRGVLALHMYSSNHDEGLPDDPAALIETGYTIGLDFTCPGVGTRPASSLKGLRSGRRSDYLFFPEGLTSKRRGRDLGRLVVGCDKPGNHGRFVNVMLADGHVKGFMGDSIEEIADREGLLLPGYNMQEEAPGRKGQPPAQRTD